MTTWTQSDLWSREWPNRRLPVSGGSHAKYVLVRSYSRISKSAWNSVCQRCRRKLNSSCWHRQLGEACACADRSGRVVGWDEDTCSRPLRRVSLPGRDLAGLTLIRGFTVKRSFCNAQLFFGDNVGRDR